ncbi:MAG: ZPR1 zinc finger domain-containing protein [Candidatus Nanoarchaeia archaeon]|nr:ZPR1 zinc finger domain-containing protein [Candidatus Nanoarchaeia archaeon]
MDKLEKQKCPFCFKDSLTLIEDETEVPYFGKLFVFSMECSSCKAKQADVESAEQKEPSKYTFTVESEKDMEIRVVKSSAATIKIPQLRMSSTPGPASEGYVSNIEGLLDRFVEVIEREKETTDDDTERKHAKNLLKKIRKIKYGDIPLKIIIEDPTGNSAIISEKANIEKLKVKK